MRFLDAVASAGPYASNLHLAPDRCYAEADSGVFSMFGRTGASQKGGPIKRQFFFIFLQRGNKPDILK